MRDANLKLKWVSARRPSKVEKVKTFFSKEMNLFIVRSSGHSHVVHQFNRRQWGSDCSFISEPSLFPLCVECNVIPFLHPTAYVCPLHRIHSYITCPYPFPTSGPVLPLPFDINCAGGCPSPSSASDRAANSTLS